MTRNIAASIRQRLLNRAKSESRPFAEILQYFALERFLDRLGCSRYSNQFVLKGALMFGVWQGLYSRPTRDIDLLGQQAQSVEQVVEAVLPQTPIALTGEFGHDRQRQTQWTAFIRRQQLKDAPAHLYEVVHLIAVFLQPVILAQIAGEAFNRHWSPGGPWAT